MRMGLTADRDVLPGRDDMEVCGDSIDKGQIVSAKHRKNQPDPGLASKPIAMNLFSLEHLNELAKELPDPAKVQHAENGYRPVIRLPMRDWNAVRDADHPDREFEAHPNAYVEFEIVMWKDTKGVSSPRWVLRGLVAM